MTQKKKNIYFFKRVMKVCALVGTVPASGPTRTATPSNCWEFLRPSATKRGTERCPWPRGEPAGMVTVAGGLDDLQPTPKAPSAVLRRQLND